MSTYTDLDIRMKEYEKASDLKLISKRPVLIRIDGRAFHTFTKGFKKPFDDILINTMKETAKYLCENVQNCVLAYTQSDEISLLLIDYEKLDTQPWFNNRVQKIVSTSAALATDIFQRSFRNSIEEFGYKNIPYWKMDGMYEELSDKQEDDLKYINCLYNAIDSKYKGFDARCWNVPKDEVANYFYWRQQDCIRNSLQMVAQANFSKKELLGKNSTSIKEMLLEKGIDWDKDFSIDKQRGSCVLKIIDTDFNKYSHTWWEVNNKIPIFKNEGREYINQFVYIEEDDYYDC